MFFDFSEDKIEAAKAAVRAKIQQVISVLKEKAEYVMEKLKEVMEMLHIKGTNILSAIKDKVTELVNSPYFDLAVAMLPEGMREPVTNMVTQLKKWLGVETAISELFRNAQNDYQYSEFHNSIGAGDFDR